MKIKYLPSEDRKNISLLKKTKNQDEIISILKNVFKRPFTLQVLWEYKKWYYMLDKGALDDNPDLKSAFIQIKLMDGDLYGAKELMDSLGEDTFYGVFSSVFSPSTGENIIVNANKLKELNFGPVPHMTITAGRPSVLSGVWDFSIYSNKLHENHYYLDDVFNTLFGEKGAKISDILMAEILYQRDECYEALVKIVGLLPLLKDRKDMRLLFVALTHQLFIMVLNNQVATSKPIIESLRKQITGVGLEEYTPNIDALEAWGAMYEGDYRCLAKWLREDAPDEYNKFCMLDIFRYFVKIRAYLVYDKHLAITFLATKLQMLLDQGFRYKDVCELQTLWAMSEFARGDKNSAFDHINIAIDLAREYRFDRTIADEGLRVYELLKEYKKHRGSDEYIERLIELSQKIAFSHPQYLKSQLPDKPSLTTSEMNVLRLLAAGHSNAEIARITETSIDNAKFHCKKIFSKLEVSSRHQAVKRAIEVGLLEPTDIIY